MQVGYIQALLVAVEVGSFTHAAPLLHLSSGSAVSKQIRQLEAELGITLITRSDRRLHLTPAGVEALPHLAAIAAGAFAVQAIRSARRDAETPRRRDQCFRNVMLTW
ncbi:helix-turn-helix domain-containing protein [Nocardioides albus]|uniref:helix-turn-helix domain-containing protein n=1 Tax=Nocardioides albus TaxID=1841 RepID=UPI00161F36BF|nr:LysR family transcriptional regulator [Nocardioides albus]GGU43887.1 hypothetical protein GCM10007979_48880 [Nocardioides albus]